MCWNRWELLEGFGFGHCHFYLRKMDCILCTSKIQWVARSPRQFRFLAKQLHQLSESPIEHSLLYALITVGIIILVVVAAIFLRTRRFRCARLRGLHARAERPGWGFILEFYIVPNKRRLDWGRRLFNLCMEILRKRNVKDVWLLTDQAAEKFWHSLGFKETGEIDKETAQKIMGSRINQSKP